MLKANQAKATRRITFLYWRIKVSTIMSWKPGKFEISRDLRIEWLNWFFRVRLSKRRLKQGQQPSNSKLVVRHRPLNKQEHKHQRFREKNLEPPGMKKFIIKAFYYDLKTNYLTHFLSWGWRNVWWRDWRRGRNSRYKGWRWKRKQIKVSIWLEV